MLEDSERDTPREPVEREISLDDLALRFPDTTRDVDNVVFEIPPPPSPPTGGSVKQFLRDASMNLFFGILGGIALLWIVYFWPSIGPS